MRCELRQLDEGFHLGQPILGDGDRERYGGYPRLGGQSAEWARHNHIIEMDYEIVDLAVYL